MNSGDLDFIGAVIEAAYPSVAEWVAGSGWIEIGDQDRQGFVVRALDEGGLVYEKEGRREGADGAF